MAARMLQHRILSLFRSQPPIHNPVFREPFQQSLPLANTFFSRDQFYKRQKQMHTNSSCQANEDSENHESSCMQTNSDTSCISSHINNTDYNVKSTVTSNLKTSTRHDMAMVFTCKVCETRSIKTACRESYEKGVVVVRCDGCSNLHLIADRLGWFGEPGSIEDLLAARGEEVKKGNADSLNLTLEDLAGKKTLIA